MVGSILPPIGSIYRLDTRYILPPRGLYNPYNLSAEPEKILWELFIWLVVSTHLKNISQNGNLPHIGMNIKKYLKPPPSHRPCKYRLLLLPLARLWSSRPCFWREEMWQKELAFGRIKTRASMMNTHLQPGILWWERIFQLPKSKIIPWLIMIHYHIVFWFNDSLKSQPCIL